jgi:hypothetical protein
MGWGQAWELSKVFLGCPVRAGVLRGGGYTLLFAEGGGGKWVGISWAVMGCTVAARVVGGVTLDKVAMYGLPEGAREREKRRCGSISRGAK